MSDIDTASTCSDSESSNIYPTEFSTTIDPAAMTFSEMTILLDTIRNTLFLPLFNEVRHNIPVLHPFEVAKLNEISGVICRYNRAPALDRRGEWPFFAIAGPDEVLAAAILLSLFSGQKMLCESGESSGRANEAIWFLSALQRRLPLY
jgi:hypothetical protein